jgi:hypothetical protein
MKERRPLMHTRALPIHPVSPPHLQRHHAVLLVGGVLLVHLWFLAASPLWLNSSPGKPLHPQAMVTN